MMEAYDGMRLGGNLNAWLGLRGKTFRWLSQKTGISYNVVLGYSVGRVCPTLRNCVLMANALGIGLDQLYQGPNARKNIETGMREAKKQLEETMEKMQRLLRRMEREHAEE